MISSLIPTSVTCPDVVRLDIEVVGICLSSRHRLQLLSELVMTGQAWSLVRLSLMFEPDLPGGYMTLLVDKRGRGIFLLQLVIPGTWMSADLRI